MFWPKSESRLSTSRPKARLDCRSSTARSGWEARCLVIFRACASAPIARCLDQQLGAVGFAPFPDTAARAPAPGRPLDQIRLTPSADEPAASTGLHPRTLQRSCCVGNGSSLSGTTPSRWPLKVASRSARPVLRPGSWTLGQIKVSATRKVRCRRLDRFNGKPASNDQRRPASRLLPTAGGCIMPDVPPPAGGGAQAPAAC